MIEVLVDVQDGESGQFPGGGDKQVRHLHRTVVARSARGPCTSTALSSIDGVRYAVGVLVSGMPPMARFQSRPDVAEKPICSSVAVATRIRLRSMRSSHAGPSGDDARRTS